MQSCRITYRAKGDILNMSRAGGKHIFIVNCSSVEIVLLKMLLLILSREILPGRGGGGSVLL